MTWLHTSETGPLSRRTLSPEQQDAVNDALDSAAAWRAGELPWQEAARLSTGHIRALAVAVTPKTDTRRGALEALQDVLIDASGFVRTTQGTYSRRTLGEYDVVVHIHPREEGAA